MSDGHLGRPIQSTNEVVKGHFFRPRRSERASLPRDDSGLYRGHDVTKVDGSHPLFAVAQDRDRVLALGEKAGRSRAWSYLESQ